MKVAFSCVRPTLHSALVYTQWVDGHPKHGDDPPTRYYGRGNVRATLYTNHERWMGVAPGSTHPFHTGVKVLATGTMQEMWDAFLAHIRMSS